MKRLTITTAALLVASFAAVAAIEDDPAVKRTVQQVKMLDDLYKTAVVLITQHYVQDPSSLSAATASKAIFAEMKKKGWHDVRLVGFTDIMLNPKENAPKDDFENTAKAKLLAGEPDYKRVIKESDGKNYLYMATAVPVVMDKCVMCHANFKDVKTPIGALSYKIPLIE